MSEDIIKDQVREDFKATKRSLENKLSASAINAPEFYKIELCRMNSFLLSKELNSEYREFFMKHFKEQKI